jgi:hypothetical protein
MLAGTRGERPSILLVRTQAHDRPEELAPLLLSAIREHASALHRGALVVVADEGARARALPLGVS